MNLINLFTALITLKPSTGQYCVLAGLNNISFDGVLEFWDIGGDAPTLMNEASHFMVTNIAWDPTGRYVCSSNTYGGHSVENGYNMWNFQGKLTCGGF